MAVRRSRKVPFNCYLSIEQMDALDRVSEQEGKPRAELVREALERYLVGKDALAEPGPEQDGQRE